VPIEIRNIDLLLMIDPSEKRLETHVILVDEFRRLFSILESGDLDADGTPDFGPIESLHVGVVSSDMGLPTVEGIPWCDGLGADGVMRNKPEEGWRGLQVPGLDCEPTYPRFLNYTVGQDSLADAVEHFACIALHDGCGFEYSLESILKALWPASDDSITFLGETPAERTHGHGDGKNAGFLRPGTGDDASLLVIVSLTNEDDCSSADPYIFTPELYLPPGDPLLDQDWGLRCHLNRDSLYPVSRYVYALRALRPGAERQLVFATLAGVPRDLVDEAARSKVDFEDSRQREAYYDRVLADPRMQERQDPSRPPGDGHVAPSCIGPSFPPRRFVEATRAFGERGVLQSECFARDLTGRGSLSDGIDVIAANIAKAVDEACVGSP
jgi:hypothetical protein